MKVFMIVAGIVLILAGLLLALAVPVAGLLFAALGVVFFIYGKRYKKKENVTPEVQQQSEPVPTTGIQTETIKVAGISHYTDEVLSLGHENDEYQYTKKQIIENDLEDEDIPEYIFRTLPAEFVYEPENKYDINAIAIYVTGVKIGYVKSGSTAHIRNLIESGRLQSASCEIVGGNIKHYDSEEETLNKTELDYGARITMTIKEE